MKLQQLLNKKRYENFQKFLKENPDKIVKVIFFKQTGRDYGDPAWPSSIPAKTWEVSDKEKMKVKDLPKQGEKFKGETVSKIERSDLGKINIYLE